MEDSNTLKNSMLYVTFNQDASCFAVGTETGFRIYSSYPYKDSFTREMGGGIGIIEMLNRSNVLALVGGGQNPKYDQKKVIIWDDHRAKVISELSFISIVKNVKLKRDKLFVICEQKIYIFGFISFENIENLETYDNPKGIVAISTDPSKTIVAYLDKLVGSVKVRDLDNGSEITIPAHENNIACLSLNTIGTLLATCSERGTLIRVFDTKSGNKLKELRRGTEKAEIYSLVFDATSKFLACSSDRKTIHIFSLNDDVEDNAEKEEPKNHKSVMAKFATFLGFQKTYFNSEWSYAKFRVDDIKTICAFGPENTIIAVSSEGNYYQGIFDSKVGGECMKVQEKNIFKSDK